MPSSHMSRGRVRIENGTVVSDRRTLLRGGVAAVYAWGRQTGETAYTTTPAYYRRLLRARLNAVRVVCFDPWHRSNNYPHWDVGKDEDRQAFLSELDCIVELAAAHELYALIDYHDIGAYDLSYAKTFWEMIAPRYACRAHVFYELMNEPVSWWPEAYTDEVLRDQEELYRHVRRLAPETHIVLLSFANSCKDFSPQPNAHMSEVAGRLRGIDWNNASVAFHPYRTITSESILALRERVPVLCTELGLPAHAGGQHHLFMGIDGAEYGEQAMEAIGVSWFCWHEHGPVDLEKYFERGVLPDAAAKGYLWEPDYPIPTGLAAHSAIAAFFRSFPVGEAVRAMGLERAHVAVSVALAVISAMLDGAMLLTLIPISQGAASGSFDFVWRSPLLHWLAAGMPPAVRGYTGTFLLLAVFAFLIGLLKNLAHYGLHLYTGFRYGIFSARLANFVFRRYLSFGKAYFESHSAGHMAKVIDYNHDLLNLFKSLLRLISETLLVAAYLAVMVTISWRLTVVALLVFPALYVLRRWIAARTAKSVEVSQNRTLRIASQSFEVLAAIPLFRAFAREEQAGQAHLAIMEQVRNSDFRVWVYEGLLPRAQEVTTLLALLVILTAAFGVEHGGPTHIAAMFVFFFIARLTLPRLSVFHEVELEFAQKMPRMRDFFDVFNQNGKYILSEGTREFDELTDSIRFQHLTFGYPGRKPVLHDVSFEIPKGRMTALVGPSGAGKSTLASLLLRYYDILPHTIVLNGKNLRDFKIASLRRNITLVSQQVLLLDDTLRNNITFGAEGEVLESALKRAISDACLEDVVDSLPKGLETRLGADGVTLSGGQRQRVAIARALLKNAPVLLMDEATSSLDSETERLVRQAIENAVRGCTSLVIAHRLSTIQHAHKVVVLDAGRLVEEGTLRELLERRGRFYAMWEAQKF